jgi:hypothetical protein
LFLTWVHHIVSKHRSALPHQPQLLKSLQIRQVVNLAVVQEHNIKPQVLLLLLLLLLVGFLPLVRFCILPLLLLKLLQQRWQARNYLLCKSFYYQNLTFRYPRILQQLPGYCCIVWIGFYTDEPAVGCQVACCAYG